MENALGGGIGGVMGLLITGVIGLAIGAIAKLLMPGPDPGGWFVTIVLGLVGSSVGGLVMSLLGLSGVVPGLVGAVLGAVLLLFIYRLVKKG